MKKELERLKSYIKLTKPQAQKRDALEKFLESKNKVLLLDADSILFTAMYKLYNFKQIINLRREHSRDECEGIILKEGFEKFNDSVINILNFIEHDFDIDRTLYFFTTCKNNFRKEIDETYKANRKTTPLTKWVHKLKQHTISELENGGQIVHYSDTLESDDLISQVARETKVPERLIIASPDKDLKQIPACHFDYYQLKDVDMETGEMYKVYKGFSFTSEYESILYLCNQLLVGDTSDNIKGVHGIGKVKAEKLLKDKPPFGMLREVFKAYGDKERLKTNVKLMRL